MTSEVLEPLAARYAEWLGLPAAQTAEVEDDPSTVRAMPLVLRIERGDPPARTGLLEAAAAASLAVCLDWRSEQGGEWHDEVLAWTQGRIRKVARRARGSHWAAVQDLPGITCDVGGAQVRALVPTRVDAAPKKVTRLQISGSEVEPEDEGPAPDGVPLLLLNPSVEMTVGKAAAQVGHATMILAALLQQPDLAAWAARDYRCAVRTATPQQWQALHPGEAPARSWRDHGVVAVRDAGFTEIVPGTVTVLAQWRS